MNGQSIGQGIGSAWHFDGNIDIVLEVFKRKITEAGRELTRSVFFEEDLTLSRFRY